MRSRIAVASIVLLSALSARAQIVAPYFENFDGGGLPAGWTVVNLEPLAPGVLWGVDATPASMPGGATFGGSAGSLNFNDGVDTTEFDPVSAFDIGGVGTATSPLVDISGLGATVLVTFQNNYEVTASPSSGFFELRQVNILNSVGGNLQTFTIDIAGGDSNPPGTTSGPSGVYTLQTLDPTAALAGNTTIMVQYFFDGDPGGFGFSLGGPGFRGWFVDNLNVTCPDAIPPTLPVHLSPPDGSIVINPPGTVLDWTDSTDSTSCGIGTVANYVVEVDDDPLYGSINFTASPVASTALTPAFVPGTYFWHVRAVDSFGNSTLFTANTSYIVEPPLPPLAPDTLFVNERFETAQFGDSGFVNPVVDETPNLSCIYREGNTVDFSNLMEVEVSTDVLFATFDWISGPIPLAPFLAKDARCPDVTVGTTLLRDTIYFWRARFTDLGGLVGPFSVPQSFRIGDDFDFGVRQGSSHHGRRCYVATAAWGGVTEEVSSLTSLREEVLESCAMGRLASRAYATAGSSASAGVRDSKPCSSAVRLVTGPLASCASWPVATTTVLLLALAFLGLTAWRRLP
ncbi:MAG: hypothetical protein FD180_2179 [Planctomycetota bacterium]|nr:MAG: hypothetical protein FD180_2179 [Planctomycetota bacterium]